MVVNNIVVVITNVIIDYCDIISPFGLDFMYVRGAAIERATFCVIMKLRTKIVWNFLILTRCRLENLLRGEDKWILTT